MVLSNYWKAYKICTEFNANEASSPIEHRDYGLVDINGDSAGLICYQVPYFYTPITELASNIHLKQFDEIRVGSGRGQIDVTDYCLFDDITSSISEPQFTVANSVLNDGVSTIIVYSGINQTQSPFTITEMGVCKTFYDYDQANTSVVPTNSVMIAKVQLAKPIIVQPNQPFTFNCEWIEK